MIFPIGLDKDIIFSRYLWFKRLAGNARMIKKCKTFRIDDYKQYLTSLMGGKNALAVTYFFDVLILVR